MKTAEDGVDFASLREAALAPVNMQMWPCEQPAVDEGHGTSQHTILWSRAILPPKSSICFTTDIPVTRVPPRLRLTLKVVFEMQLIGPSNNVRFSWFSQ